MKKHLEMFLTMLKVGLFTFGGGYAMIALLERELVEKREYIGSEEFLDVVAIAESTPGPIAINAATYVGYKRLGFFGAALATLGVCIPSFVIIYLISLFFDEFLSLAPVANAFRGIQVAVVYLILSAGIKMLRKMKKTPLSVSVFSSVLVAMILLSLFAVKFSTVIFIIASGSVGLAVYCLRLIKERGAGK